MPKMYSSYPRFVPLPGTLACYYMGDLTLKGFALFSTLAYLIGVSFTLQVYKFIPHFAFDDLSLLIHLLKTFITLSGVLTFDSNIQ